MISLEAEIPGSAMEAHLRGIFHGLSRERDLSVAMYAPTARSRGRVARLLQLLRSTASSWRAIRRGDVVYMRWHPFGVGVTTAARLLRRPIVLEVNGSIEDITSSHRWLNRFRWVMLLCARVQFQQADYVIAVTTGLETWTRMVAPSMHAKVAVLENGAPASLARQRTEVSVPPYAIFVGELAPWQGVATMIAATRSEQWPAELVLHVVGDGRLLPDVMAAAGAPDAKIVSHGRLARREAQNLLAAAAVSLSPQGMDWQGNKWGASPIKVAESLLLGVPVVVSDINSSIDIISQERLGAVHATDDPEDLAIMVSKVYTMGTATAERDRIAEAGMAVFSWESVSERTADVVREVAR